MSFVKKLWRGDVPLYITFWLFGMIVGTVVSFFVSKYALRAPDGLTIAKVVWTVIALLYTGFMCVALWRCSNKYIGAPVWGICGRIYSAILFMSFMSFLVKAFNFIYPA